MNQLSQMLRLKSFYNKLDITKLSRQIKLKIPNLKIKLKKGKYLTIKGSFPKPTSQLILLSLIIKGSL